MDIGGRQDTGMVTIAATTMDTGMVTIVVPLPGTGPGTTRARETRQAIMFIKTGTMGLHVPEGKHITPKQASNYPGTTGKIILPGKLPKKQTRPIMFTPIKTGTFIKKMATIGKNRITENGKMPQVVIKQKQTVRTTKPGTAVAVSNRNKMLTEVRTKPAGSNSPTKMSTDQQVNEAPMIT